MTQTLSGSLVYRSVVGAADTAVPGLIIPRGTSQETWRTIGARLGKLERHLPWRIGDWAFHGEAEYGSRYEEMCALTGLEYQTLANYASVAGRFEIYRRRENLSFSHHAEVAYLGSDEEQDKWLDRALEEHLSVRDLRAAIKEHEATLSEGGTTELPGVETQADDVMATSPPSGSAELQQHLEAMRLILYCTQRNPTTQPLHRSTDTQHRHSPPHQHEEQHDHYHYHYHPYPLPSPPSGW